jgi:hypothetical protein
MKQCGCYESGKSLEENKKNIKVNIKEQAEKKKKEKETAKKNEGQGSMASKEDPSIVHKVLSWKYLPKWNTLGCVLSQREIANCTAKHAT